MASRAISRRSVMKWGVMGGAAACWPWSIGRASAQTPAVDKWIDALSKPRLARPSAVDRQGRMQYVLKMVQTSVKFHSQLPATTVWTYNGCMPGPTIQVYRHQPIRVRYINCLPTTHLLADAIDPTLHGMQHMAMMNGGQNVPDVRTVVHLHGGHVAPASDGWPEDWYVPGGRQDVLYPNDQAGCTLWYHDHAMTVTRLNVFAGLAGFYLVTDPAVEARLRLPRGAYDLPLMFQDKSFNADGSLSFPPGGVTPEHPIWTPEYFGDTPVVNDVAWPLLRVEPTRYRLRMLNASNASFYRFNFRLGGTPDGTPVAFHQIASDGGFLPAPVEMTELLMAPAERMELLFDFEPYAGQELLVTNDAKGPFPDGDDTVVPEFMKIQVAPRQGRPKVVSLSAARLRLPAFVPPVPTPNLPHRYVTLEEVMGDDGTGGHAPLHAWLSARWWDDPASETPVNGTTEVWEIINLTGDAHPIHLHLVQFQVLNREAFVDEAAVESYIAAYQGDAMGGMDMPMPDDPPAEKPMPIDPTPYLTGTPDAPAANEVGWKDTVIAPPGMVTRLVVPFEARPEWFTNGEAKYVWHCHILDHEDNEMMRPMIVKQA